MKRRLRKVLLLFAVIAGVLCTPVICNAKVKKELIQVYAEDVEEGTYEIEVDSSSSMFRIVNCELTVENGKMEAVMTMSAKGYLYVFMGTSEEALAAAEEDYIPFEENADGLHTFTVPVEALNKEIDCAAFSKRRETWYDRTLIFEADEMPGGSVSAVLVENKELEPIQMEKEDGDYSIEVTLTGGSGRASVTSPAQVHVVEGAAYVSLEWSSSSYDYMIVNGTKYYPVNTEGNSVFEIPLLALDEEVPVIADTLAMSTPHEVQYGLTFHADSLGDGAEGNTMIYMIAGCTAAVFIIGIVISHKKVKKVSDA